jgi:hypothetical protein
VPFLSEQKTVAGLSPSQETEAAELMGKVRQEVVLKVCAQTAVPTNMGPQIQVITK